MTMTVYQRGIKGHLELSHKFICVGSQRSKKFLPWTQPPLFLSVKNLAPKMVKYHSFDIFCITGMIDLASVRHTDQISS